MVLDHHALRELTPRSEGWHGDASTTGDGVVDIDAGAIVLAAGGRCFAEARRARRALHEPSQRDRRGDPDRARGGRRGSRPRRAAVPPERRCVAGDDAGLLDPRDHARLRRRAAQRGGRGVHRLARPARRRLAGDLRRGRGRTRRRDARWAARGLARHDPHPGGRRGRLAALHAAALPWCRHRPAAARGSSRTRCSTTRTAAW